MFFASDNASGVPAQVLDALAQANAGFAVPYGNDALSAAVRDQIRATFEAPGAEVFLVATGSAANALALSVLCPPFGAVFCHRLAHIEEDECGAPEFYTNGAKLTLVDGADGKMTPGALDAALRSHGGSLHNVQNAAVSVTNITELGTLYALEELRALTDIARAHGLPVHLDGARFANAVAALGCTPAEMTWRAGVDVVTFGGTKNGLMGVEAVVIFDPARAREFQLRRKRGGHLFSKHRYLAAQMSAYLEGDLWRDLAARANGHAAALEGVLRGVPGVRLLHPRGGNMIFASWSAEADARARAAGAVFNAHDADAPGRMAGRLVCSWNSDLAGIAAFADALRGG
ncbi:threonine aldolase family protein [Roseicitreum antarcticum]|uniref:L-threonine aldolase n=1 Tax=Roseicitreum antarcticum TaxID=564137 RepID=A0A1H2RY16_9RHOB|nr:beta-eliminating lyase-related protein [Roseicitreum antarcticum]SDW24188.1 L-threonine aldolase [Roseicitreum antarcticum]